VHKRIVCLLAVVWPAAAQAGFTALDLPGSQLIALSHDGCIAAGSLVGREAGGFRWTAGGRVELLREAVTVRGLSASGRYVSGSLLDAQARQVAAYWDATGRPHALGHLSGSAALGQVSEAFGISDEPRAVGSTRRASRGSAAFVWTPDEGMRELPAPPQTSARALGLGDGRRIYGWLQTGGSLNGVVWESGRARALSGAGGEPIGELLGADHRGEILLGVSARNDGGRVAYRWTDAAGVETLAPVTDVAQRYLFASSDDGRVMVGGSGTGERSQALVWLQGRAFLSLERLLSERGIALPADWHPAVLTAISGDGERLAGWGRVGERLDSFVVDLGSRDAARVCAAK